jgi:hypothetical protein
MKDSELRKFYNVPELPIFLHKLAILYYRIYFDIGGRRYILKMAVVNVKL